MSIIERFFSQFSKPTGILGILVGKLMARSNQSINEWTIRQLNIQPDDHILEIGFGPGVGITQAAKELVNGKVYGIDFSDVMVKQATARNREDVRKGKVILSQSNIEDLPKFDVLFDKVFSVNSIIFWEDPIESLKKLNVVMKNDGLIAITVQPRFKGAADNHTEEIGEQIENNLKSAGFREVERKILRIKPVSAICVVARR